MNGLGLGVRYSPLVRRILKCNPIYGQSIKQMKFGDVRKMHKIFCMSVNFARNTPQI